MFIVFPAIDYNSEGIRKIIGYILPAIFWVALILAIALQVVIAKKNQAVGKGWWGVVLFFKNKASLVFDILFILSVIAVAVVLFVDKLNQFVVFSIFSTFVFSFEMHSVLNGKHFNYLLMKEDNK